MGQHDDRLWTIPFVALTVAELAYFSAIGVAIYALPLFVTGPLAADEASAGIAFGAFALTALLFRPVCGRLADTWGRRPLLLVGAGLCALGMALLPAAGSLSVVVAIRALQGVGEAAFFVAGLAMLADLAPPSRLGEALSYNSLGLYLGIALGPALAEFLLDRHGFDTTWVGAAALAVLAVAVVAAIGETRASTPGTTRRRGRLVHVASVPVALGFFCSLLAVSGFLAFASLHAADLGLGSTGGGLVTYGATVVLCRIVFARVPDRVPSVPLAAASLLVIATGLATLAAWSTSAGFYTGVVLLAVGVAFSTPAFFGAIFERADPEDRGAASGTAGAFLDLGLGLGPVVLGVVAVQLGVTGAFAVGALVAVGGCLWMLVLRHQSLATS